MMPFAEPIGGYYASIYKPAIERAKLTAVRADADIYGTGKIIDQIWKGIHAARVLVAELTNRNPNVLYELGLAHALYKPVVLVSSNKDDVPFDVQHVRVIYYEKEDPFWGQKLIRKSQRISYPRYKTRRMRFCSKHQGDKTEPLHAGGVGPLKSFDQSTTYFSRDSSRSTPVSHRPSPSRSG